MESAEIKDITPNREAIIARIRERRPDRPLELDEDIFGAINEDYDEYDGQIAEFKKRDSDLMEMFARDPRSAQFMMNWRDGEDPALLLIRMFGSELREALDDPEKMEEISKAHDEYLKRVSDSRDLEEEFKANIGKSMEQIEKMQEAEGISDEDIDAALEFITTLCTDQVKGIISPEAVHMALKALNHDKDVAIAEEDGEVRGRNARIEEKLRSAKKGDGMAALDGKNAEVSLNPEDKRKYGALDVIGSRGSIWERGGEKRTKY